jgi:hypothetical protein
MQIRPLQAEQYSIKKGDLTKTIPVQYNLGDFWLRLWLKFLTLTDLNPTGRKLPGYKGTA